jgi:diketogulonate reductase-like aldo/keto reductase
MPFSVGHGSDTTVADNAGRGDIVVQAYSPLQGGGLVHDADCTKIGAAHGNKTAVQVRRDEERETPHVYSGVCVL